MLPLLAIFIAAMAADANALKNSFNGYTLQLLFNTAVLIALTLLIALPLGVISAWYLYRYSFRFKALATITAILPMAFPSVVFTTAWLIVSEHLPVPVFLQHGVIAAAIILALTCFPYITILVASALQRSSSNLPVAIRMMGGSRYQVMRHALWPAIAPATSGGAILVALHVIADFGVVDLLRYQTFTWAIYQQLTGHFNIAQAALLSLIPLLVSFALLMWQQRLNQRNKSANYDGKSGIKKTNLLKLTIIYSWFLILALLIVIIPLAVLFDAASNHFQSESARAFSILELTGNSLLFAAIAVVLSLLIAWPVAWKQWLKNSRFNRLVSALASASFGLPGPILALGVLVAFIWVFGNSAINRYGFLLLGIGLALRMLPLTLQSYGSGLHSMPKNMLNACQLMGISRWQKLKAVFLPWLSPAIVSGAVLVFVETVKELPLTLLLRPVGYDTLAVRIWTDASEEMLDQAASASLMLIALSLPAVIILYRRLSKI